jgi:hypothetical protein
VAYLMPGKCRYCGCTESNACVLQDGDTCSWHDNTRTVCTAPGCVRQFIADSRRRRPVRRKKSTAEVHAEIMRRGRRGKRAA